MGTTFLTMRKKRAAANGLGTPRRISKGINRNPRLRELRLQQTRNPLQCQVGHCHHSIAEAGPIHVTDEP